jgi:hypothetical protein
MTEENEIPEIEDVGGTADELTGPKLLVQYSNDEKKQMLIKADEEFGPFVVIAFEDIGHAGFMMQFVNVTPEMLAGAIKRLDVMTEMRMAAAIAQDQQRQTMGKIHVPGQNPGLKPMPKFKP